MRHELRKSWVIDSLTNRYSVRSLTRKKSKITRIVAGAQSGTHLALAPS
jgi:hypothetical protein